MTRIAIVTDSSADLAPDVAANAGITVAPVAIELGLDAAPGLSPMAAGAPGATATRDSPRATTPDEAVEAFAGAFAALAATHDAIVAVLLSRRLGGVVNAAEQASKRLGDRVPIEVVDSRSVSLGLGFQALRAAALAGQGASVAEIAAALRDATACHHVLFSVESLEHLRQSGQIGRSAAMIADALQLKPLLRIDEGQIVPFERVRTRERAREALAGFVSSLPAVERCAVLYTSDRGDALALRQAIAVGTGLAPDRLDVARIGAATAGRVGPGALGVAVVEPDPR